MKPMSKDELMQLYVEMSDEIHANRKIKQDSKGWKNDLYYLVQHGKLEVLKQVMGYTINGYPESEVE